MRHPECSRGACLPSLGREPVETTEVWRLASATPDLRLPSQPQDITATKL